MAKEVKLIFKTTIAEVQNENGDLVGDYATVIAYLSGFLYI